MDLENITRAINTLWQLFACVLIFLMHVGFTMVESGTVQRKSHQTIILMNVICPCISGLIWWAWGYKFAFGWDNQFSRAHWVLNFGFASLCASIVSGSIAERARVSSYGVFVVVMTGVIYPLLVSWTWGGGWLYKIGFYDYAGSGAVHLTGGVAGLVGAYVCGPRLGKFKPIRHEGDYDQVYFADNNNSENDEDFNGYRKVITNLK